MREICCLKTKNIGIIITDHNVHETLAITDRAYLLYDGSILESGTAEQLANNPEVRRKYLGQNFELRKAVLHDRKDEDNGTSNSSNGTANNSAGNDTNSENTKPSAVSPDMQTAEETKEPVANESYLEKATELEKQ